MPSNNNKVKQVKKPDEWQIHEKEARVFSVTDKNALLKKFFAPDTIINKIALWKPDPQAKFGGMNISDDGYCHTDMDTVIKIPNSGHEQQAYLIVFTTMPYDTTGDVNGGHVCGANYGGAIVRQDKDLAWYNIEDFNRNFTSAGTYGNKADSIALVRVGKEKYAIDIPLRWVGGGSDEGSETLFELVGVEPCFSPVFTLQNYVSNDGQCDSASYGLYSISKTMKFIPGKDNGEYYDIGISTVHNYYNKRHKQVTDKSIQHYAWNIEDGQYEQVKE